WDESDQIRRNGALFDSALHESLYKITLHGEIVGFWGYREELDAFSGFHMQLLSKARSQGIGSCILAQMADLSTQKRKPVLLKVFRTNPALHLYERFGFQILSENDSHFFMRLEARQPT
ncbi:MAG: GNAT family N-acetyltransferase, partial [Eubacteriales bacterium]|nr:GNAT family N-acetyltransferase [Eubacteriales bacterium]